MISHRDIKIHPRRISSILDCATPVDKTSLMHFLGIVNYINKFIPKKSDVEPLNSLLRDDAHFVWTNIQENDFKKQKH